jgi:hypothetical protein
VGLLVGKLVGLFVGGFVGFFVGELVGCKVGPAVGHAVTCFPSLQAINWSCDEQVRYPSPSKGQMCVPMSPELHQLPLFAILFWHLKASLVLAPVFDDMTYQSGFGSYSNQITVDLLHTAPLSIWILVLDANWLRQIVTTLSKYHSRIF